MTGEHFRRLVFETVAFFFGDANRFLKTKPRYFLFIISPILILFTPLKKNTMPLWVQSSGRQGMDVGSGPRILILF